VATAIAAGTLAWTCGTALAASDAADASPRFGDIQTKRHRVQKYTCATGKIFNVTYLSATNGQSFAIVPVKGHLMLFVNTLAGSGAKYQAGSYTWWTKGPHADLYDAMAGPDASPVVPDCVTIIR
jgi:membrane-bound inhibitor of C-type lysozyme